MSWWSRGEGEVERWPSRIEGEICADEVVIGRGVVVEPGAMIRAQNGPARRVVLGDFCYVGRDTKIFAPEFRLGDYSKWHERGFCWGAGALQIGRCCWIGGGVILDSAGGLTLDDGVGVGAGSQLWTHIRFGDVVEGCRFNSRRFMHVGRDAWFVGHCLVSPVSVGERSMAMLGSVIARDMLPNRVYGGVPAADITAKVGPQFEPRTVAQKAAALGELIAAFEAQHPEHAGRLEVVTREPLARRVGVTYFDVSSRTYTQICSPAEVAFLKANVPLVKFAPAGAGAFVDAPDEESTREIVAL